MAPHAPAAAAHGALAGSCSLRRKLVLPACCCVCACNAARCPRHHAALLPPQAAPTASAAPHTPTLALAQASARPGRHHRAASARGLCTQLTAVCTCTSSMHVGSSKLKRSVPNLMSRPPQPWAALMTPTPGCRAALSACAVLAALPPRTLRQRYRPHLKVRSSLSGTWCAR